MSTVFESDLTQAELTSNQAQAVETLQENWLALRLSLHKWGTSKSLTKEQKAQAARGFEAEGKAISASKKLIDTKSPELGAVTSIQNAAKSYWISVSLPYPEKGVRLIKPERLNEIEYQLNEYRRQLWDAVLELDSVFSRLKDERRRDLGNLFNESDYPATLVGSFSIDWDTPNLRAPEYLQALNPRAYAAQCQRVESRFTEAVEMAEAIFTDELIKLVDHLQSVMEDLSNGKKRKLYDSAIDNFTEFFSRFRALNIGSNADLEALVSECEQIVSGVGSVQRLRHGSLRSEVARRMEGLRESIGGVLENVPCRNIDRGANQEGGAE